MKTSSPDTRHGKHTSERRENAARFLQAILAHSGLQPWPNSFIDDAVHYADALAEKLDEKAPKGGKVEDDGETA